MRVRLMMLIPMLMLGGCAVTLNNQVAAFGDSVLAVTEKVDGVMGEYNNASLERQFTEYASLYNGPNAKALSSEKLLEISQPITPEVKKKLAISMANQALGGYASALSELATADFRTQIDLASAKLYGSMSSINDQYKLIQKTEENLFDTDDLALVSKLIAAIGSQIVEAERKKALKRIVIAADKNIAIMCDQIIAQLTLSGMEEAIAASRQYVLSEEILEYKKRIEKSSKLDWRRKELKRLYGLKQQIITSKLMVQQTKKAVLLVKTSHAKLAEALKNDKFTSASVAQMIGRLRQTVKHYDDYENLLLSCKKISKDDKGILSCDD